MILSKEYIDERTSKTINIVKFLAIILVLYLHSYFKPQISFVDKDVCLVIPTWFEYLQNGVSQIIARIAVPLFFFLAGFLLYRKTFYWQENLHKKVKSVLIPFFIFNTLGIMTYYILQQIPMFSMYFSSTDNIISNWNFNNWINAYVGYKTGFPLLYPLWFLIDLFILNVLSKIIEILLTKYKIVFFSIVAFIYICSCIMPLNIFLQQFILSLFYWILGYIFVKSKISFDNIATYTKKYHILPMYCIIFFLCLITRNLVLVAFSIIIGIFCLIGIIHGIKNIKVQNMLLKLSNFTFPIYLMHEFPLTFLRKILGLILPNISICIILEYLFCPIVILVYCILISIILKNYVPSVYSIITGNRSDKKIYNTLEKE